MDQGGLVRARLRDLRQGSHFVTLVTGRSGRVLKQVQPAVKVQWADGPLDRMQSIHGGVVVEEDPDLPWDWMVEL